MLTKLRSRGGPAILAGVVIVAMVATGAVGLFNAMFSEDTRQAPPERSQGQPPQQQDQAEAEPAPEIDALGDPPDQVSYEDVQENCESGECYRIVGLNGDGLNGEEAVETVYDHLLGQDWGQVDPSGGDPADVPASETILTDGTVMVQGNPQAHAEAPETDGFLILGHATAPGQ
ncbi:hypothetical protein F4561_005099 [Lipingzhangella halophila]|uniref:Uncharacterized protein n=1 Tax=Lipingzhangella halophila TaxID=1783352 RepID=A0A7W7RLP4_9ACTN|nr:hypothetical protein [Lipingzhangella halophila]MBB4934279.1 hypothetical protein [Lipingzhangella halophila]